MLNIDLKKAGFVFLTFFLLVVGCKKSAPPQALSAEQAPPALQKVFNKAKPEIKNLADQAASSLQSQDFPKALAELEALLKVKELSDEQRAVATRVMLTANEQLQAAQARGDQKAAEVLKFRQMNK